MTKERFNEIIFDLQLLVSIKKIGICAAVRHLWLYDHVTEDEHDRIKTTIDSELSKIKENYTFYGDELEEASYKFPNFEERLKFLEEIKLK